MPRHGWWRSLSLSLRWPRAWRFSGPSACPRCRGGLVCRSRVNCPSALWSSPLLPSSSVVCLRGRSGPRRPCGAPRAPGVPPCAVAPHAFRCSDRSPRQSSSGSAWPRWRHGSWAVRSSSAPPPPAPSTWSTLRCRRSRAWLSPLRWWWCIDAKRTRSERNSHNDSVRQRHSWAPRTRRCASPVCTRWPPLRMKVRSSRGASNASMCCAAICVCPTTRTPAATTSASSSQRQHGRRHHRPSTSRRRGGKRSGRTTARSATRSFAFCRNVFPPRPTPAGQATTSISPACCSRTPGLQARGSAAGTCGLTAPSSAALMPRSKTWNSTPKSYRSTGPASNPTPRSPGRRFGPAAHRSTVPPSAARTRHSTRRGSQASMSRFDASGSPASRRRSARRCSSACARRSTRPPSGRTSSSTGTTLLAEASRRSRAASRRGRGRRTWSIRSPGEPRPPAPEKDDNLDG